jgi:hypothetical protein
MELVTLENSNEQIYTHPNFACGGKYCTIHNRSDHPMRSFPQHWRIDRAIMERICDHGVGHPDPDEYKIKGDSGKWEMVHGCDGCCEGSYDSL